ncbi:YggT family protein [Guggenheimella bovis]
MREQLALLFANFLGYYQYVILIHAILSWFIPETHMIRRMLGLLTEPIEAPFRNLQMKLFGPSAFDLSPLFAMVFLQIAETILYNFI